MKIRINKAVAERCEISRRKADALIAEGRVTVNGIRAELGLLVDEDDEIRLDGRTTVSEKQQQVVVMLNKPVGYMTTMDQSKRDTVLDLVQWNEGRLFPIGRLDVESSGLLLMTNDGQLANRLMHPRYAHEKEYDVVIDGLLTESDVSRMRKGVVLDDGAVTKPAEVLKLSDKRFRITVREGRNRQIRRMVEAIGHRVKQLHRIRISGINLGPLRFGEWRRLSASEVKSLEGEGIQTYTKKKVQKRK
jgi:pseudouridine synthase